MFGADGVRPKALAERCEAEKMAAEKALQDSLTASSSTAQASVPSGSGQQASIFDDDYDEKTRKYVQDLRDWYYPYLSVLYVIACALICSSFDTLCLIVIICAC